MVLAAFYPCCCGIDFTILASNLRLPQESVENCGRHFFAPVPTPHHVGCGFWCGVLDVEIWLLKPPTLVMLNAVVAVPGAVLCKNAMPLQVSAVPRKLNRLFLRATVTHTRVLNAV